MDKKLIKDIVDLMERSDLREFEIEEEGLKLRICRGAEEAAPVVMAPPAAIAAAPAIPNGAQASAPAAEDAGLDVIKSPMVGTFYKTPSPDKPAFVNIGDSVNPSSVVCILEAMKVMNEIQAEMDGTIAEILVENGQTVEFGQPLFKVKKSN